MTAVFLAHIFGSDSVAAQTIDEFLRRPNQLLNLDCPSNDSLLLPKGFFTICYHTEWRIPRWVAYHIQAPDLEGDVARTEDFREDPAIENTAFRSSLTDYKGTGYHRGHMAPAEAFDRSLVAMSTTFLLSNMAPQTPSLNSGKWRSLEAQVLKVVGAHRAVWVITGNLFAKEKRRRNSPERIFSTLDPLTLPRNMKRHWIGGGRVAVPTHSFKAILVARNTSEFAAFGFIMPNQRTRLAGDVERYKTSIDEIEKLTGIDVYAALEDDLEDRLEFDTPAWPPKRERRR